MKIFKLTVVQDDKGIVTGKQMNNGFNDIELIGIFMKQIHNINKIIDDGQVDITEYGDEKDE